MRDLKSILCKHNQNKVELVYYIKAFAKNVKYDVVSAKTSDANLLFQLFSNLLIQWHFNRDILLLHIPCLLYHYTQCLKI